MYFNRSIFTLIERPISRFQANIYVQRHPKNEKMEYPSKESLVDVYVASTSEIVFYTPGAARSVSEAFANRNAKRTFVDFWAPAMIERRSKNFKRYKAFARVFSSILAEKAAGTA